MQETLASTLGMSASRIHLACTQVMWVSVVVSEVSKPVM